MDEHFQDYSLILDFEADFLCSMESQPQNTELGSE